jgi:hypothetical protein
MRSSCGRSRGPRRRAARAQRLAEDGPASGEWATVPLADLADEGAPAHAASPEDPRTLARAGFDAAARALRAVDAGDIDAVRRELEEALARFGRLR